jgi:predicted transcriptional regulator
MPTQFDLFDAPKKVRKKIIYRPTSRAALEEMRPHMGELDRLIVEAIENSGPDGITCEAIEEKIGRSHQAVSGNLSHLVNRDKVVRDSGQSGLTRSGRKAVKWVIA